MVIVSGSEKRITYPNPTAEIKVPAKAKVKITPKFLKKFSYIK